MKKKLTISIMLSLLPAFCLLFYACDSPGGSSLTPVNTDTGLKAVGTHNVVYNLKIEGSGSMAAPRQGRVSAEKGDNYVLMMILPNGTVKECKGKIIGKISDTGNGTRFELKNSEKGEEYSITIKDNQLVFIEGDIPEIIENHTAEEFEGPLISINKNTGLEGAWYETTPPKEGELPRVGTPNTIGIDARQTIICDGENYSNINSTFRDKDKDPNDSKHYHGTVIDGIYRPGIGKGKFVADETVPNVIWEQTNTSEWNWQIGDFEEKTTYQEKGRPCKFSISADGNELKVLSICLTEVDDDEYNPCVPDCGCDWEKILDDFGGGISRTSSIEEMEKAGIPCHYQTFIRMKIE